MPSCRLERALVETPVTVLKDKWVHRRTGGRGHSLVWFWFPNPGRGGESFSWGGDWWRLFFLETSFWGEKGFQEIECLQLKIILGPKWRILGWHILILLMDPIQCFHIHSDGLRLTSMPTLWESPPSLPPSLSPSSCSSFFHRYSQYLENKKWGRGRPNLTWGTL